jgi:hypothetical protein
MLYVSVCCGTFQNADNILQLFSDDDKKSFRGGDYRCIISTIKYRYVCVRWIRKVISTGEKITMFAIDGAFF